MKLRLNGRFIGTGLLGLALAGGVGAWAIARQPQPGTAGGQPPAKAVERNHQESDEVVIKLAEAPEAVRAALVKMAVSDKVTKVIKEEDEGITTYEVEYKADGTDCSAVLSASGDVMEIEKGVKESALPAAALAALRKEYPGAAFGNHTAVQKFYYEVEVTIDGKKHGVRIDGAGNVEDESTGGDEKDEHAEGNERGKGEKHDGKKGEKDEDDD